MVVGSFGDANDIQVLLAPQLYNERSWSLTKKFVNSSKFRTGDHDIPLEMTFTAVAQSKLLN